MLQFHLTRLFGLKFKTHGMASPGSEGLELVFREGDAPSKLFDQEIRSVMLAWPNVRDIGIKKGWVGTQVRIVVHAATAIEGLPVSDENELALDIHREHLADIERFMRQVERFRAGETRDDVDTFVDDVRDFLRRREP